MSDVAGRHATRRWTVGHGLLLVGLTAIGCGGGEVPETPPVVRPIRMMEIGEAVAAMRREYPGRVEATLEAQLSFEVTGRIVSFPVTEGQLVRKGQLIARLDPVDYEAKLTAAKADLNAARADFERFEELLEKDAVSRRDYETRRRNYEVAQAQLQIAEKSVADTRLVAPFSGRVARKLVDDFQNVPAKQPVALLHDDSVLEVRVTVPEADLALGDATAPPPDFSVEVEVTSFPGRRFPGRLTEISTAADPVTRTFEATVAFEPTPEVRILPGMTARVLTSVDRVSRVGDAYAVPSVATAIDDQGRSYVWKIDSASMEVSQFRVELGELQGDQVLVTSGLAPGDLIATSGVHHLREGMRVRRLDP